MDTDDLFPAELAAALAAQPPKSVYVDHGLSDEDFDDDGFEDEYEPRSIYLSDEDAYAADVCQKRWNP